MRILSWDVGILNLAYCLIEYDNDNKWKIIDWDIINITERENTKCFQCNKKSSLIHKLSNKHSCKVHANLIDTKLDDFETLFTSNCDNKCQYVGKKECDKKSKFCYKDNFYCNTHAKSLYSRIENENKITKFKDTSISSLTIDFLRERLVTELEKRKNLYTANVVVIENQPTLKNPKMKAISSTVYDYYLIRGIFDKSITKSNIAKVKYMSPSNKLKLANEDDTLKLVKLKGDDAKTYKLTKSLGIKYCKEMIKDTDWINKIETSKKKDDLADSFLQGMYYIFNC